MLLLFFVGVSILITNYECNHTLEFLFICAEIYWSNDVGVSGLLCSGWVTFYRHLVLHSHPKWLETCMPLSSLCYSAKICTHASWTFPYIWITCFEVKYVYPVSTILLRKWKLNVSCNSNYTSLYGSLKNC